MRRCCGAGRRLAGRSPVRASISITRSAPRSPAARHPHAQDRRTVRARARELQSLPEMTQGAFVFRAGGGFTAFQNFLRGNSGGACGERCSYSETDIDVINRFRSGRYELYAQDTWRMHPEVTLDLGLRYAFYPPLTDDERQALHLFARRLRPRPGTDLRRRGRILCCRGGQGICSTAFAWPARTRHMGAPSMRPTRTTCSPVSGPHGIQAEQAA